MRLRIFIALVLGASLACAAEKPPEKPNTTPLFVEGVRQTPVTQKEVEFTVAQRRSKLAACYRDERLNSPRLARFLFELTIPNDGGAAGVELLTMEPTGQPLLQSCILRALENLRFPPHVGETFRLRVPIEPLDRL